MSKSAFPIPPPIMGRMGNIECSPDTGMTLRDYFAAQVLTFCAEHAPPGEAAEQAYVLADAMLKAREASNG